MVSIISSPTRVITSLTGHTNPGDLLTLADGQAVFAPNWLPAYGSYGPFFVSLGYGASAATIRIGANDAFTHGGRGALQIGGAGPKDSGNGSYLVNDGHPNWNVIQSSIAANPTEFIIQGNGVCGVATSDGAGNLTRTTGPLWTSAMVGLFLWFDGAVYTVSSVPDGSHAVLTSSAPAGTAVWHFAYTTGSGTCAVASGVVTRTSGDPFIPNTFGTGFTFNLGSTAYTVSTYTDSDTLSVSSPPADGSYAYSYRTNINNQVTTLRVELAAGSDEENLSIYGTPFGYYLDSQFSGNGKRRSLFITSEGQAVADFAASGKFVALGGPQNAEALRALWQASTVNRFDVVGGITGSGPSFRSRGTDTNVDAGYDTQGTGAHVFTSGSFGRTSFKVLGSSGVDYLAVNAGTGAASLNAQGTSANVDVQIVPRGSGVVKLGFGVANTLDVVGGSTGFGPSVRARGSDTNIPVGYDSQGTGAHVFTSGSFGRTNFKVFGSAGVDFLTVDAGTGNVNFAAGGSSANIDISILPKGTGVVRVGTFTTNADAPITGYITVKDAAGNTRKLATIA